MKIKVMNLSFYIAFTISILLLFLVSYMKSNVNIEDQYLLVELSADDTIWELAEEHADYHSLSYSEFISWIEEHNEVNVEEVRAGFKIMIPVKKLKLEDNETLIAIADGWVVK